MMVEDIDYQALQELIVRVEHAIEHDLALEADDLRLLLSAIHTLMAVQSRLEDKDITLNKLRKLLGMIKSSEKRESSGSHDKRKPALTSKKKPKSRQKLKPIKTVQYNLVDTVKGDTCPECPSGKLSKKPPSVLLRISGSAPLEAVKHIAQQLKCNLCDHVVTAPLPEVVLQDGDAQQQYGYSARSVMSIHKHFSGIPYYHQATLNELFGCPVTASTIFDQCEYVANEILPIFYEMKRKAANANLIYIDDTNNRILDQKPEQRPKRNGKGTQLRSGIYTSGLIAVTQTGEKLYLYNTNLGHAGEHLDDILRLRETALPPPIIMSDALSRNLPTVVDNAIIALCNAHARRQFVDVEVHHPHKVGLILDLYGQIWRHDHECEDLGLDEGQRLAYHKEHSLPVLEKLGAECTSTLALPECEEHSGFGKACKYFLKHDEGLTQFCKVSGAPIDNNLMEEGLKTAIRSRKTSHFYKTQTGADVANVLTSVIVTAYRNDINPYHYLNCLQRNARSVKADPASWLPWSVSMHSPELLDSS
ncbi:MAG: transposase [Pseudomonadales bacterium]|nr:transposase [Pseudomonadales bacterium]